MSDGRDPKIRLFGTTIGLPETAAEGGGAVSLRCREASGDDDGSNRERPCSSDSTMVGGGSLNRDAEGEEESREVWIGIDDFFCLFLNCGDCPLIDWVMWIKGRAQFMIVC